MKIKDGMTYENFMREFKYDGILSIITNKNGDKYLKTFEKYDNIPKNMLFIEEKNNEYYFNLNDEKYCFFNQVGKNILDIIESNKGNIFLKKKIIIINDNPTNSTIIVPNHKIDQVIEKHIEKL